MDITLPDIDRLLFAVATILLSEYGADLFPVIEVLRY